MNVDEVLTRGVESILPDKDGLKKLMQDKQITLYQGFDPSMPSLHLGNYVGVMKLRQFQRLGHKIIFLIGDFTGMIGDPTDKLAVRKQLSREDVAKNSENWKSQITSLIAFDGDNPAEIKRNSEWNDKVSFSDLIGITSNFTVQQMLERDMFQKRLQKNKPIYLHEFLYPIAQGYDFVAMDVDLEIGGNDQLFNMLTGRTLMKAMKGKDKYVLTTKLLVDKEGNKVGKTTGNALFLSSSPKDFYGGIMTFPDEVVELGFELLTEVPLDGLGEQIKKDPMNEKKRLAYEVVKLIWNEEDAKNAQAYFEKTFQEGKLPEKGIEIKVDEKINVIDAAVKVCSSKSEAKRLLAQKALDINGETVNDPKQMLNIGDILKVGKKDFIKIVSK